MRQLFCFLVLPLFIINCSQVVLNRMKYVVFFTLIMALLSCKTDGISDKELMQFFYSADNSPKIYVYQDSINPLFEVFERVFVVEDEINGKIFWIEKYNADYRLMETHQFSYNNNMDVLNHLVLVRGDLYNAEVRDSTFFPIHGQSHFSSTFPSNRDSIIFHYDMKRTLLSDKKTHTFNKQDFIAIEVIDSIASYAIDFRNELEKKTESVAITTYAQGLGKVQTKSNNGKVNLKLTRVLTDEEWKFIITK